MCSVLHCTIISVGTGSPSDSPEQRLFMHYSLLYSSIKLDIGSAGYIFPDLLLELNSWALPVTPPDAPTFIKA